MICPQCGSQQPNGAAFCDQCGAALGGIAPAPSAAAPSPIPTVGPTTCPSCGAPVIPGEAFCNNCGAALSPMPPAPAASVPPTMPTPPSAVPFPPPSTPGIGVQTCPQCGALVEPGSAFCDMCGARLVVGPAPAPQPPTPPPAYPPPGPTTIPTPGYPPAAPPQVPYPPAYPTAGAVSGKLIVQGTNAVLPFPPGKSEILIGREDPVSNIFPDIDLTPHGGDEGGVSRRHARIFAQGNQLFIEDLNSTNYTYVNQQKLTPGQPHPLKDGDEVRLGKVRLIYMS
ncbi:MAG: zinc ribbon domain-containing protein [Anaerolineae bacterium]|nr:zinc ribbon domain-containing protein [Anaerolineae bacterium]